MECFNCGVEIIGNVFFEHNGNIYCKTCNDEFFISKISRLKGQKTGFTSEGSVIHQNEDTEHLNAMPEKLSGTDDQDLFGEV